MSGILNISTKEVHNFIWDDYYCVGELYDPIPKLSEVLSAVQPIQSRWYELFLYLGIQRDVLEKCFTNHPCDDHSSLVEVVLHWLQRTFPPPSWTELVDVIENILLEGTVAHDIKLTYCPTENAGIYIYYSYASVLPIKLVT